jgi:hypothetical protein
LRSHENTIKDTVKSVTGDTDDPLPEEMELIRDKEDVILENAEIIGYKMVMQIAERAFCLMMRMNKLMFL